MALLLTPTNGRSASPATKKLIVMYSRASQHRAKFSLPG
jgi:hypothetical protein